VTGCHNPSAASTSPTIHQSCAVSIIRQSRETTDSRQNGQRGARFRVRGLPLDLHRATPSGNHVTAISGDVIKDRRAKTAEKYQRFADQN